LYEYTVIYVLLFCFERATFFFLFFLLSLVWLLFFFVYVFIFILAASAFRLVRPLRFPPYHVCVYEANRMQTLLLFSMSRQ
jgi:hypothetical protein